VKIFSLAVSVELFVLHFSMGFSAVQPNDYDDDEDGSGNSVTKYKCVLFCVMLMVVSEHASVTLRETSLMQRRRWNSEATVSQQTRATIKKPQYTRLSLSHI